LSTEINLTVFAVMCWFALTDSRLAMATSCEKVPNQPQSH